MTAFAIIVNQIRLAPRIANLSPRNIVMQVAGD